MASRTARTTGTGTGAAGGGFGLSWLAPVVGLAAIALALFFALLRPAYPVPKPGGIVVVTGTSSGIGNAVTLDLADKGFTVYAGVRRQASKEAWGRVENPNIHPVLLDVTDTTSIQAVVKMVEKARTKGTNFAGFVGNAGIGYHMPIEHHNLGDARRLFDVNFFGNLALVQAFLPIVREDKARIVFISSLAGRITQPKEGIYSASKSAVKSLADALRQELYPHSVSVSLVEPGFVATPILGKILDSEEVGNSTAAAKDYKELYTGKYFRIFEWGMGRAGRPETVARKVHEALTARHPRTRYPCTNFLTVPTYLAIFAKWVLPDRLFDKIVMP